MKTGIIINGFEPEEVRKNAAHIASLGYDTVDMQAFIDTETGLFSCSDGEYERLLREDARAIRESGLEISQVHGPWRYPPRDASPEDRTERFGKMSRAIVGTSILGCRYMVVHPLMPFGREDNDEKTVWEVNIAFFRELAKVAVKHGVVVCLENMPFPGQSQASAPNTLRLIHDIGADGIGFCLDTGHCLRTGDEPSEALRLAIKEKHLVLHVHDNDGTKDQHLIPGRGIADWKTFARTLREVGFSGSVSIETHLRLDGMSPEEALAEERELYRAARGIAENEI